MATTPGAARADANIRRTDGPFATITRAQRAVRDAQRPRATRQTTPEDVIVVLRGGVYALTKPLTFGLADGGRPGRADVLNIQTHAPQRVISRAYPGETPVISGGERIGGWRRCEVDGRAALRAELPNVRRCSWRFSQLWVNGARARRPRWPNRGLLRIEALLGKVLWGGDKLKMLFTGQDAFRFAPGDLAAWRNVTDIEMVALHFWIESRIPFASIDVAKRVARLQWRSRMRLSDDFSGREPARYYVDNVFEALDEPGQFYLDRTSGVLYYPPRDGETDESIEAYAPRLTQLVHVRGTIGKPVSHLRFEGIAFEHSESVAGDEQFSSTPQAACHVPGAVVVRHAHDIEFENCAFRHVGGYGVEIADGSERVRVARCAITDLGGGGVKVWHGFKPGVGPQPGSGPDIWPTSTCKHVTISDCENSDGGYRYHQSVGVLIGLCSNVQVVHNHIHDFDYTALAWVGTGAMTIPPRSAT